MNTLCLLLVPRLRLSTSEGKLSYTKRHARYNVFIIFQNLTLYCCCRVWEEDEDSGGDGMNCLVRIHSHDTLEDFLRNNGSVPIPPYFNRKAEASDKERYNNVYAKRTGSVAAPTAGLHFTDAVLGELGSDNVSNLTLHVGAGTFKPVLSADARDHVMHGETFAVNVGELRPVSYTHLTLPTICSV